MNAAALRQIEADLIRIAADASAEHPIDPHDIRIIAIKIAAQAEMREKGIEE